MFKRLSTDMNTQHWKVLMSGFVNAFGLIVPIYISLYLNKLNYSVQLIGNIIAIFGFFGILGGYYGGVLSDKISPVTVCKMSLLSSSLLLVLLVFAQHLNLIVLTIGLFGFSTNLFRPAFILSITDNVKTELLEKSIALRRVAINLGMAVGAAICGIIAHYNEKWVFLFVAGASLFAYLLIFNVTSSHQTSSKHKTDCTVNTGYARQNFLLLLAMVPVLLIFNQSQALYPIYLKNNIALTALNISLVFMVNGLLVALLQVPLSTYLAKYQKLTVMLAGSGLIFFGFGLTPLCDTLAKVLLLAILWTLGEIIFFPAHMALLLKNTTMNKGKMMGHYQLFFSATLFFAPLLGTHLYALHPNLIWELSLIFLMINLMTLSPPVSIKVKEYL